MGNYISIIYYIYSQGHLTKFKSHGHILILSIFIQCNLILCKHDGGSFKVDNNITQNYKKQHY